MRTDLSKKIVHGGLLFEIGTEEMPALFLSYGENRLKERSRIIFAASNLSVNDKDIDVFMTPRRLVLHLKRIPIRQTSVKTEIIGPSKELAFDREGNPTAAYKGFAKSQGVDLKDIKFKKTDRGEYIYIVKEIHSELTISLLPELLREIILQLEFPKTMQWDALELRFPRPIRWLLAIYDTSYETRIIRFQTGNITSGNHTFINREPIRIDNIKDYFGKLKSSNIIIDHKIRMESIRVQINALSDKRPLKERAKKRGLVSWDAQMNELLKEVTFLTESPKVFLGRFSEKYSKELPLDILSACLSKYQRLFGIYDTFSLSEKRLMPYFFGVADGTFDKKTIGLITKNYEYILNARLKDALFFYNEDLKISLDERVNMLKGLVFLEGLGSMYEKTERLKELSGFICDELNLSETDKENAGRSAELCKADLTTLMVKEFPGLQGSIGRLYARLQGENREVADSIRQHYLPRYLGDETPGHNIGYVVSIADKLDTLMSCFGIGLEPTGSEDPYGLKRCANGIIYVIVQKKWMLSLERLIGKGIELFKDKLKLRSDTLANRLKNYFKFRFEEFCLRFEKDIVQSVVMSSFDEMYSSYNRCKVLNQIRNEDYFRKACKVVERTNNILKSISNEAGSVDINRFVLPLEMELWRVYENSSSKIERYIEDAKYKEATETYGEEFFDIIHRFFDRVLVNVEDEPLRYNRLSLMKAIRNLYTQNIADLSVITPQPYLLPSP